MTLLTFDFQGVFHTRDWIYIPELFLFLQSLDTHTAIISNLPHESLTRELRSQHIRLENISIYGYEDMENKAAAIRELQSVWNPTQTIFVTDSARDVYDVSRTHATILGVTWGFGSAAELQKAGAHAILLTPKLLLDQLKTYL